MATVEVMGVRNTRAAEGAAHRVSRWREKLPVLVLFLPPALVLFSVFVILPMGEAAWYSLYNWNGYGLPTQFVGFRNFEVLFRLSEAKE